MEFKEFLKNAAHVKPSDNQLRHLRETPFYAFVHFSPNTYTNLEKESNIIPYVFWNDKRNGLTLIARRT